MSMDAVAAITVVVSFTLLVALAFYAGYWLGGFQSTVYWQLRYKLGRRPTDQEQLKAMHSAWSNYGREPQPKTTTTTK